MDDFHIKCLGDQGGILFDHLKNAIAQKNFQFYIQTKEAMLDSLRMEFDTVGADRILKTIVFFATEEVLTDAQLLHFF